MDTTDSIREPRRMRWHRLALVPVALLAWVGFGAAGGGVANAATSTTTTTTTSTTTTTTVAAADAAQDRGNGGVGQLVGQGNAAHAETAAVPTDADTSSTLVDATAAATPSTDTAGSDHTAGTAGTVGDPTAPQPLSNADLNPGGANNGGDCGAYCSTRDGSPSLNGNGDGQATGKPCAGCVGRADNKNPPGQQPDGTDANNGYECDGNNGIGKTNPAHTGCTTTPTVTPPCTDTPGHPCTPTPPCTSNCGGVGDCSTTPAGCGGETECVPSAANHQCGEESPSCVPTQANDFCTEVEGERNVPPRRPPAVLHTRTVRTPPIATAPVSRLPFTGADTTALLMTGMGSLLLGGLLLGLGRRPSGAHRRL
jgi:hypothetical protein